MGRLVIAAMDTAVDVLFNPDTARAQAVIAGDAVIDALEHAVGTEAARVIALHAPAASDLRMVLAILKMSSDLERAGDHAKTIARRSLTIDSLPAGPEAIAILTEIATKVRKMLTDAMEAFTSSDAALAEDVRQRDFEVDELYNRFVRTALRGIGEARARPRRRAATAIRRQGSRTDGRPRHQPGRADHLPVDRPPAPRTPPQGRARHPAAGRTG